jgi:precorrin-6B methylase 2
MYSKFEEYSLINNEKIYISNGRGVFTPNNTSLSLIAAVTDDIKIPGKLLDLGCGGGIVGISLAKLDKLSTPLYASDYSQEAIDLLENNCKKNAINVVARQGDLFEPWYQQKFDYIINDISGISEEVAKISPWFKDVPCNTGIDGSTLTIRVIEESSLHLNTNGSIFFPILSLSNKDKILQSANKNYKNLQLISFKSWPLPKEMYQYEDLMCQLKEKGHIDYEKKFGMIICTTYIYKANN